MGNECVAVLARGGYDKVEYINPKKRDDGFRLTYTNGDKCGTMPRRVVHHFRCDPNVHQDLESVNEAFT